MSTSTACSFLEATVNVTEYCTASTMEGAMPMIAEQLRDMPPPFLGVLVGTIVLVYVMLMLLLVNTDHTLSSILKMNATQGDRPPVAPFGIFECVHKMTSDQQPWFPLEAKKAMGNTDTFVLPLPRRPVMTGDYALAREILMDPLSTKPRTYLEMEPLGVGSIFTRNGAFWHARRKGAAPAFSNHHIKRMKQIALEITEKWIRDVLLPCAREGRSFDVGKEMISISLEAICITAFEYEISDEEKNVFVENLELQFLEFLHKSINNPFRKYMGRLLPGRRRALQAAHENADLAMKIIGHYRANPNSLKGTIIDHLVNNPCYADDNELAADLLLFLTAGHDTTAYTMAFTLIQLAKHPPEQKKVRDEILAARDAGDATASSWKRAGALQMAIKESMRLFPVSASGSARVCGRDFVTKEGWIIPKGTGVVSHIMMTHRNQNVFGPDADEYRSDRWIDPTQAQKDSFLLFSAGKQNCIGQSLAQAELHCMIPRILSEVELEVEDPGSITWFLTLKPKGCRLRPVAKPRTGEATSTTQR